MPITFKRAGQEAVTLENVSFKGVALDKVTFKRAGQEAVTVFEKGETWVFNDKLTSFPNETGYNVTFICATTEYIYFKRGIIYDPPVNTRYALSYALTGSSAITAYDQTSGWKDNKYRSVTITGGADINDTEFLNWIKANAVKQSK